MLPTLYQLIILEFIDQKECQSVCHWSHVNESQDWLHSKYQLAQEILEPQKCLTIASQLPGLLHIRLPKHWFLIHHCKWLILLERTEQGRMVKFVF